MTTPNVREVRRGSPYATPVAERIAVGGYRPVVARGPVLASPFGPGRFDPALRAPVVGVVPATGAVRIAESPGERAYRRADRIGRGTR